MVYPVHIKQKTVSTLPVQNTLVVFKTKISNLYFCVCSLMYSKRKLLANFYNFFLIGPPGIFENENFEARAPVRSTRALRNFRF